jgi:hypothetical protein
MGAICGAGTHCCSGTHDFTPVHMYRWVAISDWGKLCSFYVKDSLQHHAMKNVCQELLQIKHPSIEEGGNGGILLSDSQ